MSDPIRRQALRRQMRVERYATILGHVVHFGRERAGEVAARFGLTAQAWTELDEAWGLELAECLRRQQNQQASRFASVFFRVRADLASRSPALASIGEGAPGGESVPEAPPLAAEAASGPARVAASFQLASQPRVVEAPTGSLAPEPAAGSALPPAPPRFDGLAGAAAPRRASRTAELRESKLRAAAGKEMPFAAVDDDDPLQLPLERYALITVRLAQREDRVSVLSEFQMSEAQWLVDAKRWSGRLQKDPALMKSYIDLVGRLKGELARGR